MKKSLITSEPGLLTLSAVLSRNMPNLFMKETNLCMLYARNNDNTGTIYMSRYKN